MKLRTKLSLLAGGVLLLAALVCSALSLSMSCGAILEQAGRSAYFQSEAVFSSFNTWCAQLNSQVTPSMGAYWMKSQKDDYSILLYNGEVCYNPTVLDPDELTINRMPGNGIQHAGLYHGRRLLAYRSYGVDDFTLIHLVDVTDTYFSIYRLAAREALLLAAVLLAGTAAVFLILRRALRPLQALSEGAKSITAGAYGQRVPESGRDELGSLGRDFNRMAQAVEEHIRRVEESEEQKTMFMASLNHELKTPLTAISGYAQTLRYAKLGEEDKELALRYICRESGRLDRLAKKMLRLLELDHDTPLTMEPVPLSELAGAAQETCLPAARGKGVGVRLGGCQGSWLCDRDLLTEAAVNLVDNGVKACKEGGTVRIYTHGGALVVEDDGCGIPENEIAHLTEAFYMVDKSRSRQSGGAGMGLALTAVILRRHGLALRIESQVGQGTRVYIEATPQTSRLKT